MKSKIAYITILLCLVTGQLTGQVKELLYVQTDKQLYLAGELVWLKLYSTDEQGRLQSFSKVGYIELVSDSNPEVQAKIDIKDGVGAGWIELPAMLETGYYRLTAYTRYMRNEGEEAFFEKVIAVVNPFQRDEDNIAAESADPPLIESNQSNNIQLTVDKSQYDKRSRGTVSIKGLPDEYASLAISVTGKDPFPLQQYSVNDWKEKISRQNYAFTNNKLLPEYEGAIIEGQLFDIESGQPTVMQNVKSIISFPGKDIQLFGGQQNEDGIISFYTQQIAGKKELTTSVLPQDFGRYRVDLLSPFVQHSSKKTPKLLMDAKWKDYLSIRNLTLQVAHAYTLDSLNRTPALPPYLHLKPTWRYILDEYTRFQYIEDIMVEFIPGVRVRKTNGKRHFAVLGETYFSTGYVLALLDNIPITDHDQMCNYNPLLLNKIEVYSGKHIFGGEIFDGIIHFTSYKNDFPSITFSENTQLFDYEGTQPYRYFYSPIYEGYPSRSRVPDFRHTLLWEPDIQSDGNEEINIPFYTSDLPGTYQVTVEGISKEGKAIYGTYTFEVK